MQVEVGKKIPPFVVDSVDPEKMKTVAALLADPNPIHFDLDCVRALGLARRAVNQGPSNLGYVVNMLTQWVGGPAGVRSVRVRFLGNVFAGDRVVARGTVTAVREEDSERLADVAVVLERDESDLVLDGEATVVLPDA